MVWATVSRSDLRRHRRGLPNAVGGLLELVRTGAMSIIVALFIVVLVGLVTYFVVFVERGQRKILVNYASAARWATRCMAASRRTCR